ncbi:MAG: hypothetical protein QM687_11455 [Ferruginibacter sp.]
MTITSERSLYSTALFYRITALWVICEAFAGGIMHAAKIPFTGMLVSGLAVFCIMMLAWFIPARNAILKATVIVAIFKLALSPHSPPTAYIAVFFQGTMGWLLLRKKIFTASAMLVAALSLVESGAQRLLVVWLLYGNSFWQAVNEFINRLIGSGSEKNVSLLLAAGYIIIHALTGLLIGLYGSRLIRRTASWKEKYPSFIITADDTIEEKIIPQKRKGKKLKLLLVICWLILLAFYLQSVIAPAQAILPKGKIMMIALRSLLIIGGWSLFISPLIMSWLRKKLQALQQHNAAHFNRTSEVLPAIKNIFLKSWRLSATYTGLKRFRIFLIILLINITHPATNH